MFELKCTVLAYNPSTFPGKDGQPVVYNTAMLRIGSKIYKITSSVDLTDYVDDEIVLNFEMSPAQDLKPKVKIVSVRE